MHPRRIISDRETSFPFQTVAPRRRSNRGFGYL